MACAPGGLEVGKRAAAGCADQAPLRVLGSQALLAAAAGSPAERLGIE